MRPPLADRLRPKRLSEIVGQQDWLAPDAPLRVMLDRGELPSMVVWGPPGCGKTTLAKALTSDHGARFIQLSAVLDGVKQLRQVLDDTAPTPMDTRPTVLFVDEIHRWNKAQQDALLPHVESGRITLIGATTENPSFSLNPALQSRLRIFRLEPLGADELVALLRRALEHPDGVDADHDDDALAVIANAAGGDARRALTDLEHAVHTLRDGQRLDKAHVVEALGKRAVRYDRAGDNHYDVISAFIKSMRGSDPDAAIYWLARMLEGGEDPRFIARRLVIFASEDVGNADPRALSVAVAAADAARHIGMPEVRIVLAQATTWLAAAPKSNASYVAIDKALEDVRAHGALPVPPYLRSRPPEGSPAYEYPHDAPNRVVGQPYLPERLRGRQYYEPVDHGEERVIRKRLDWWNQRR